MPLTAPASGAFLQEHTKRLKKINFATFLIAFCAIPTLATGQNRLKTSDSSNRPLRTIVGFPGGSSPDLTALAMAQVNRIQTDATLFGGIIKTLRVINPSLYLLAFGA